MLWRLLVQSWLVFPVSVANSHTQHPFPTPSPFSFSGTTTRRTYTPSMHHLNLFLRFLQLLFSFISALTLATPPANNNGGQRSPSFTEYPELMYGFIVSILAFLYAAFQLFKVDWLPCHLICFSSNTDHSTTGWAKHTTLEGNHCIN